MSHVFAASFVLFLVDIIALASTERGWVAAGLFCAMWALSVVAVEAQWRVDGAA